MIHFIIGCAATLLYWWLRNYSKEKDIKLNRVKNAATVFGILYTVLVAEIIVGFIHEQEFKAALVMGATTGIFAIIWGVLLGRFVFRLQINFKKKKQ